MAATISSKECQGSHSFDQKKFQEFFRFPRSLFNIFEGIKLMALGKFDASKMNIVNKNLKNLLIFIHRCSLSVQIFIHSDFKHDSNFIILNNLLKLNK